MSTHKLTKLILIVYTLLTIYTLVSLYAGVPYQPFFTPLLTLLAFTFAVQHGSQNLGWKRTLLLLLLTFTISLLFESVGVATGKIYGGYYYTDKLGYKFLGLVPLLIPVAWFMMTYPSYVIANRVVPAFKSTWIWRVVVAAIGAVVMTAWDLVMDPMMVAGDHWVWEEPGAYFGIPIQNYLGWFVTTFVTFWLFLTLARIHPEQQDRSADSFKQLAVWSYAIVGVSTILTDFLFGLDGPALVGIFAMLPWVLMGWWTTVKQVYIHKQ
jgi:putative membrane protein